ncbi:hypothetical protein PMIT1320_00266 [Prochlorococcus marinus str. MIT 1320]|nr:hypothetical protein PMIT1320_00266 [Prochlorococcus marinus str. MIT 1320]
MLAEFKTLFELSQEGYFKKLMESAREVLDVPVNTFSNSTISSQIVIGIIAIVILGVIILPFGATEASIKACQVNTNKKLIKVGGSVIVVMTSLSAILYLEVLKLYGVFSSS